MASIPRGRRGVTAVKRDPVANGRIGEAGAGAEVGGRPAGFPQPKINALRRAEQLNRHDGLHMGQDSGPICRTAAGPMLT